MAQKELHTSGEPLYKQCQEQGNQPLPHVWDVLERKVKLHTPEVMYNPPPSWSKMVTDLGEQEERLRDKGSDYDRAVLDLYTAVTSPGSDRTRFLTLKQFKQLRSDFEELPPDEIVEGKRQLWPA